MVSLVVLLVVLFCLGPIAFFLVLSSRGEVARLKRRIEELEFQVRGGAAASGAAAVAAPAPAIPGVAVPAPATGAAPPPVPEPAAGPAAPRLDLETILGGQWLTWIGILAIFFGTAFFLAFDLGDHPLAGAGQVLVGLLVGAGFIAGGRLTGAKRGTFLARGLLGGGVALLFLSAYASHAFHRLVPAVVVYPFLFGAATLGALLALREGSLMVATLTLVGALLTPVFLAPSPETSAALFVYLAAVNLGAALVSRRRWSLLPVLAFAGTALLVTWWWAETYTMDLRPVAAAGTAALWLLYAAAPLVPRDPPGFPGIPRSFVLVANGLLFELVLFELLAPDLETVRGLATGLLAAAYVVAARALEARRGGDSPAIALTRTTGLALAALAVPVQFDLQWVTLGWALFALALLHAGLSASGAGERLLGYGVLLLAVVRALVLDTEAALWNLDEYRPVLNGNFLVGVATAAVLGWAARMVARARPRLSRFERGLVAPLVLTAAIVLLVRVCVETVALFRVREALTGGDLRLPMLLTLSLVSAVYAGLLILGGFVFRYRPVRFLGIVVLGLVLVKVFALDIEELERGYRIASFVGVGLLLLLISVLYQRGRGKA